MENRRTIIRKNDPEKIAREVSSERIWMFIAIALLLVGLLLLQLTS